MARNFTILCHDFNLRMTHERLLCKIKTIQAWLYAEIPTKKLKIKNMKRKNKSKQ